MPVKPRLQTHEPIAVCPEDECPEFDGHARQVLAAVAPTVAEYVLAPQSVHAAEPVAVLYLPAAHAVHASLVQDAPPSGPVYPMLHLQDVIPTCPVNECAEFCTQPAQLHCPLPDPYVFTGQSTHVF